MNPNNEVNNNNQIPNNMMPNANPVPMQPQPAVNPQAVQQPMAGVQIAQPQTTIEMQNVGQPTVGTPMAQAQPLAGMQAMQPQPTMETPNVVQQPVMGMQSVGQQPVGTPVAQAQPMAGMQTMQPQQAAIGAQAAQPQQAGNMQPQQPGQNTQPQQGQTPQPTAEAAKTKKKQKIILIVIIAVILLVAGVSSYFIYTNAIAGGGGGGSCVENLQTDVRMIYDGKLAVASGDTQYIFENDAEFLYNALDFEEISLNACDLKDVTNVNFNAGESSISKAANRYELYNKENNSKINATNINALITELGYHSFGTYTEELTYISYEGFMSYDVVVQLANGKKVTAECSKAFPTDKLKSLEANKKYTFTFEVKEDTFEPILYVLTGIK